jgi:hypothetical protein
MADIHLPARQREALLELAEALVSRAGALRRDECGDWRINGAKGHVYSVAGIIGRPDAEGFLLYCEAGSPRAWGYAKKALGFCAATQDGDDEGILFLDRLPSEAEAKIIRAKLGIPKKRIVSEEERARLAVQLAPYRFEKRRATDAEVQAEKPASDVLEAE